jgi:tRNA (guanine26-N2/guanine27-N2)-dimethyltransferase
LSKSTEPLAGLKILEAFSATGLRSIRYAKEVVSPDGKPLISKIIANDWSKTAVARISHNVNENQVADIVFPNQAGEIAL